MHVIDFNAVIAGSATDFDQNAFKATLSTTLGVQTSEITLNVTAASVRVEADIVATTTSHKDAIFALLVPLEANTSAASALLGVQVEAVETVTSSVVTTSPPPPPPPASPPPVDAAVALTVIAAVASSVVVIAMAIIWLLRKRLPITRVYNKQPSDTVGLLSAPTGASPERWVPSLTGLKE